MFVESGPFALQSHCHYPYQQRVWATMPVSFLRSLSARGSFAAARLHGFDIMLKGCHGLLGILHLPDDAYRMASGLNH